MKTISFLFAHFASPSRPPIGGLRFKISLFLTVMFFGIICLHANKPSYPKTYIHYLNDKDGNIKVSVLSIKVNVKPKEDLIYFWFHYNQVMSTRGGYDGYLLHGEYTSFYVNNNLKEKGIYKNGLREGKWMTWYENGSVKEISWYKHGMKHGHYELYNELGQMMVKTNFCANKIHGRMRTFSNNKVQDQKKFRHGKEVVKKSRTKKIDNIENKLPAEDKEQKKTDEKIKRELKKKSKQDKKTRQSEKKSETKPKAEKEKKSFKEKLRSIFKKRSKNESKKNN
jgi:hypothetical protein